MNAFKATTPPDVNEAQALRDLARQYELRGRGCHTEFTCTAVGEAISWDARVRYGRVFEIGGYQADNAVDLWNARDKRSLRVLMLCFAAAMAETGDL